MRARAGLGHGLLVALLAWALAAASWPAWADAPAAEPWPVTLHRSQPLAQERAEQALAQARSTAQRAQAWRQLADLNGATWKAGDATVAGWGRKPPPDKAPLELRADDLAD